MSLDEPGSPRVWRFPGGLRLDANKAAATAQPIADERPEGVTLWRL